MCSLFRPEAEKKKSVITKQRQRPDLTHCIMTKEHIEYSDLSQLASCYDNQKNLKNIYADTGIKTKL
jgi:hypothetical protein